MPFKDKEKEKEYRKKYNKEHPKRSKKYYDENREDILKRMKKYRKNNKDTYCSWQSKYYRSEKGRFSAAKGAAKRKNREFNISYDNFVKVISEPCYYCNNELGNSSITGSGLDRLDNLIDYILSNVVSCCKICNQIKSDCLTSEETKIAVAAILDFRKIKLSSI